jgi:hypothetical protein
MSPSQVESEIQITGGRAFMHNHNYDETWKRVLGGIASAEPRWLAIGESLWQRSDAGAAQDLSEAFFAALAVEPLRALPILMRIYRSSPEELCNQTFDSQAPKQGVKAYLLAVERGLRQAKGDEQRTLAAGCSRGLSASRAYAKANGLW